jgi:hypothetical protein
MWTSYEYDRRARPEPEFYLPRMLGGKLSVLVALLVLYLCVCHQLIRYMSPIAVDLGIAHAEAVAMLTVFGGADTIMTFTVGHKHYDLTRYMVAHADLFVRCGRALLWRIECGTIWAGLLVVAPPVLKYCALTAVDAWSSPLPEPRSASPNQEAPTAPSAPPPASHRYLSSEPFRESAEEVEIAVLPPRSDEAVSSPLEVRKRPRKAKKASPSDDENPAPPLPPSAPLVQPGQVRKRPKPEA